MPQASPLPRKYLACINEAQEFLRIIAAKSQRAQEEVSTSNRSATHLLALLREIEAMSYRIALELSNIEVAKDCNQCPSAPAVTSLQAYTLVLASELERHVKLLRSEALG